MINSCKQRRYISFVLSVILVAGLVVAIEAFQSTILSTTQPALAQRIRPEGVWQVIYEKLPYLPLENQYVNKETKKVATDNTLVGRFIRYHIYTKGRPAFYRLDWKVTMADYLGANGAMDESTYPSHDTLRTNPMEGDIAAIKRLNLQQRNDLIQALVDAFSSQNSQ